MLGSTIHEYAFIRACITLLRLVAPASLIYLSSCIYTKSFTLNSATPSWIFAIALFEASFYVFVYRPRKKTLQKVCSIYTAPPLNRQQRETLFHQCSQPVSLPQDSDSTYPLGWFSSPNLKRENLVEWILWALFSCSPEQAGTYAHEHVQGEWKDEIDGYVKNIEELLGMKVEEGHTEKTTSLRLTLDPVKMVHRPLIWYMIVCLVDTVTSVKLYTLGFRHYSPELSYKRVFPPRIVTLISKASATNHFSYWYRPHKSLDRDPIVFIHGIGIGLHPYVPFFQDLIRLDPNQGFLLVELLPVSMHMCSSISSDPPTPTIPPRREMLDALYTTMYSLKMSRAVLASHSYGTVIAAHVIRDQGETSDASVDSSPQIRQSIFTAHLLIDPIPFLLHLPDVAFNFLYRIPQGANEWQLWYFASRDPDIAFTLGRCFFWAENILWKEDLDKVKFAVVLSEKDQIVPAPLVRRYLTGEDEVKSSGLSSDLSNLEVLYYPGLDHAMIFDTKERRRGMVRILDRFSRTHSE
ncbi:hypothetical protein J3R30DRAFT_3277708 [Lentinula aciculospora]|uniref:AB hydrolase-1 domain-containing protein n=1 Tax=Lentinula aciculospora TaxID=153920 RepID=A0A9W9DY23_9AGAR|nr:hypothetical protein J3R30DRAFT_3277708 [Lentinula aciculospora]